MAVSYTYKDAAEHNLQRGGKLKMTYISSWFYFYTFGLVKFVTPDKFQAQIHSNRENGIQTSNMESCSKQK